MKAMTKLSVGALVAVVALLCGAVFGGTADAKKNHKKCGTVRASKTTATPIAAGTAAMQGLTKVPMTLPKKKTKGCVVSFDTVTVTFQLQGAVGGSLDGLVIKLVDAADGRTVGIEDPAGAGDTAVGPLTETPDTDIQLCPPFPAACTDPLGLPRPWHGAAWNPSLAKFGGVPVGHEWDLIIEDANTTGATLVSVSVTINQLEGIGHGRRYF